MGRRTKSVQELLREKSSRTQLNWSEFNFLENLLLFCLLSNRSVPKESGISFSITIEEADASICLLFRIDRDRDPLVRNPETPRPDYLALYCSNGTCVLTIIEMKGGKDTSRALDQIIAFKQILKTEFQKHLPGRFASRVALQGILLHSSQQQVPLERIKRQEREGFVVLPLGYNQRAELLTYVSKENRLTDSGKLVRYSHYRSRGQGRAFNSLEAILVNGSLHTRIRDESFKRRFRNHQERTGVYLNYAGNDNEYCALIVGTDEATIACTGGHEKLLEFIFGELAKIGERNAFKAEVIK